MNDSNLVRDLVYDINEYSNELGVPPTQLSKAKFLKKFGSKYSAYDLEKVGGFKSLVTTHFRDHDKDLKFIQFQKQQAQYISKLEKVVGNLDSFYDKLMRDVSKVMGTMVVNVKPLDKKLTQDYLNSLSEDDKSTNDRRSIVTIWSDQHFGAYVDPQELGNKNEFNWTIGARRLGMLCEQVATYKAEKRKCHDELVILLIGDNIAGVIHAQEGLHVDLITHQICGTTSYYIQALEYLKNFFPKIRVICQPGNHGRVMHKASKDRALQQKYDSFENIIFYALSQKFAKDPKVSFEVTKAPFSDVTVQGHRIYATHGDTVFDTGNVGKTISTERLETQVNRINAEELKNRRKPFEMFCSGHVHHPLFTHTTSGAAIAINGCLIGLDSYGHGIGVQSSMPVQVMWETTKEFVQGDHRCIYLHKADKATRYETIIQPYNFELTV